MEQQDETAPGPERPYRSHLHPACLPCRRRKSRCQTDAGSDSCMTCRAHRTQCVFPEKPGMRMPERTGGARRRTLGSSLYSSGRPRFANPRRSPVSLGTPTPAQGTTAACINQASNPVEEESPLALGSADDQPHNLHIVGPAVTNDNQVLSDYLSAIPGVTRGASLVPVTAGRSRPVLFTMVQKKPVGLSVNRSPSTERLETIEKLLEPHAADVIDAYFSKTNVCFPLLDEVSFRRQYRENKNRISPALLACLYAHALVYWRHSPNLSRSRCPDTRFIWNLANEAAYSELHLSPGMSIIKAILLNVGGRPTTSLIGNSVLLGSAVSMAHSLGLNHNPLPWEIPASEKHLRMKIWWALLVQDRWTSLAHGTPPHISRTQYDVPQPELEYLRESIAEDGSSTHAASVFVALVDLTLVLDQHLEHIYQVGVEKTSSKAASLQLALNSWIESLGDNIRRIIIRGTHLDLDVPGAANLRLAYLTTRLLLERIELEADKQSCGPQEERLLNRYIQARRTSEEMLIFVQELLPEHLGGFWLSISAFAFPATVTFLLRCALETESSPAGLARSGSFRVARDLVSILRSHQDAHGWDLGDICLAQHAETIEKISAGAASQDEGLDDIFDVRDFVMPDLSIIDQFYPSLWDPMQNAW